MSEGSKAILRLGEKIRTLIEGELGDDLPEAKYCEIAVEALDGELEGFKMRLGELSEEDD